MADVAVTFTFAPNTTAASAQVNTNLTDITTWLNQRNAGSATWDKVYISATSATPLSVISSGSTTEVSIDNTATLGDPMVSFKLSASAAWALGCDDSDSDRFKISASSALGTNDYLIIDATTTACKIKGTNTNDSGTALYVGEYVESVVAYASRISAATSTQFGNVTSISLTAGDWDVQGIVGFDKNGATVVYTELAISTNSGNTTTDHVIGSNDINAIIPVANVDGTGTISSYRVSVSSTTTIYLKASASYSVATPKVYGRISARRVR